MQSGGGEVGREGEGGGKPREQWNGSGPWPVGAWSWGQPVYEAGSPVAATLPTKRWTRTSQFPVKVFTLVTLCDQSLR